MNLILGYTIERREWPIFLGESMAHMVCGINEKVGSYRLYYIRRHLAALHTDNYISHDLSVQTWTRYIPGRDTYLSSTL